MSVVDDWDRIYAQQVRPAVSWLPAAVFVERQDGVNAAYKMGPLPVTVAPPLMGSVPIVVSGPPGSFGIAVPSSAVDVDFVAHEAGHGAHDSASAQRDLVERRGTAFYDIVREVAAILSPGVVWPSAGPDLRAEYVAEAFRKAITGNVAQLRYPNPPGQISPYPIAALRAYFATMNQPRVTVVPLAPPAPNVFSYPITRGFMDMSFPQYGPHTGIDLGIPAGTEIGAVRGGAVVLDDDSADGLEGISVKIRHQDGATSWYAHMSMNFVTSGEVIQAGQSIGRCGSTGAATGPHLHLEVRDASGTLIDPLIYFAEEADMSFTDEDRRKLERVYAHQEAYEPLVWIGRLQKWLAKAIHSIWPNADLSGPDVDSGQPFKP